MFLLTDRPDGSLRLWQDLCLIRPCRVVPLHEPIPDIERSAFTICDVALDRAASVMRLREVLGRLHAPGAPLLCLVHERSHHLTTQAVAVGATEILDPAAPREVLCARIIAMSGRTDDGGDGDGKRRALARDGVLRTGLAFSRLFDAAAAKGPVSSDALLQGGDAVLEAVRQSDISAWLDVVWNHDDITYQHCLLVAGLAAAFAQALGFREQDQRLLSQAALLHDIGKACIPRALLNKPGRLTADEMETMRAHAAMGHQLLVRQGGFDERLLDVVRHHHEYLDGTGYPDGLQGAAISDLSRLTTICDIHAALIERRAYKPPISPDKAFAMMVGMGGKLDQDLLRAFRPVALAIGPVRPGQDASPS